MKSGLMPAHPASFIYRDIYNKYGFYNENYKIASDFEFFLKILFKKKIPFKIINKNLVRMRMGGVSSYNLKSYYKTSKEIYQIFKENKIKANILNVIIRIPLKIHQLFFYDEKKLNQNFQNFQIKFDKKYIFNNSFKLISNVNKLINKKKFILSGLNLAFLGYLGSKKLNLHEDLYHWVDGIWAKKFVNLDKKPGRDVLQELVLTKEIKNITVIGNLTKKSKKYLYKRFKVKINNIKLPYLSIEDLKKEKFDIKFPGKTLIFITLPTPKQEQLALFLSKKFNQFKIICIGASLSIASGEESAVPNFLKNFEYVWRLRTDTLRRFIRLFNTFYHYYKNSLIFNKYNLIRFLEIE